MSDFNVGNSFGFQKVRASEVAHSDVNEAAYVAGQMEELKAQTDLSLDPSAVIGKSLVKEVNKTPKYDPVLLESILKFMREEPGAVAAFNDAYEAAVEQGYNAQTATAFAEEALEKFVKNKVQNSTYKPPYDFD
jgi:hypothetical protein